VSEYMYAFDGFLEMCTCVLACLQRFKKHEDMCTYVHVLFTHHMYIYTYMHANMHFHIHGKNENHIHACMHATSMLRACMYTHIQTEYNDMYAKECVPMYQRTFIHTQICIHTHKDR